MGLLDALERLITEHGSAGILRQHVALFRDQVLALEKENAQLRAKAAILETQNAQLQQEKTDLQVQARDLEQQLAGPHAAPATGYVCDHCGSRKLQRTGSRPDPTFGDVGIKQALFRCADCGKESAFTQDA